jgi:hypothetical protein
MKKENYFDFIDRCLKDLTTGRIRVSRRDRQYVSANLQRAGYGTKRSFQNTDELIDAYIDGMDDVEAMLVFEHLRITQGDLPDPLDVLEDWTDLSRREYLGIRIIVKLNHLGVESFNFSQWVIDHFGSQFVDADGRIAYRNEKLMLVLDRVLAEMVNIAGKRDD